MMPRVRRRNTQLARTLERSPLVAELLTAAQHEAAALRQDSVGTEHMLLAIVGRADETARTLRGNGLAPESIREHVRRLAGAGLAPQDAFDSEALGAIGIDLPAIRERVEATFGEGALERASRHPGTCIGSAFGVAPELKRALEHAQIDAAR